MGRGEGEGECVMEGCVRGIFVWVMGSGVGEEGEWCGRGGGGWGMGRGGWGVRWGRAWWSSVEGGEGWCGWGGGGIGMEGEGKRRGCVREGIGRCWEGREGEGRGNVGVGVGGECGRVMCEV